MRIQGGMSGLIAAFTAGRLDPEDADFEPVIDLHPPHSNNADWRDHHRRTRRRLKRFMRFARLGRVADDLPF